MKKALFVAFLLITSCSWAQTFSAVAPNGNGYEIYYEVIDASHVGVVRPKIIGE